MLWLIKISFIFLFPLEEGKHGFQASKMFVFNFHHSCSNLSLESLIPKCGEFESIFSSKRVYISMI